MRLALLAVVAAVPVLIGADAPVLSLDQLETRLASDADNIRFGSEYRQAVIKANAYERSIKFFEKLTADNPKASMAHLNHGFAYVDKIPASGAITQVILANTALTQFTKSIDTKVSWIALYTRGNSYLFWPRIFDRAKLGVADLERAVEMQKKEPVRVFHSRAWVSLGDGYWKTDQLDRAIATWKEGAKLFPNHAGLKARLAKTGDDLKAHIDSELDPTKRVDTDLHEIWEAK